MPSQKMNIVNLRASPTKALYSSVLILVYRKLNRVLARGDEIPIFRCLKINGRSGGGGMFSLFLLDRRWCDSSGRQAVWDVFVFRCLLQRYPTIVVSING